MKYKLAAVGLILFLVGCQSSGDQATDSGMSSAREQRKTLVLIKEPLIELSEGGSASLMCNGTYKVDGGRDVPDLRDFPYFSCQGRYTLTLTGKKGTTVTLFRQFNFQKEKGFMVIVKKDNRKLWVINLDDIERGKWVSVPANRDTGAYDVFLKSKSMFDQFISSAKWGLWWQGDTPG